MMFLDAQCQHNVGSGHLAGFPSGQIGQEDAQNTVYACRKCVHSVPLGTGQANRGEEGKEIQSRTRLRQAFLFARSVLLFLPMSSIHSPDACSCNQSSCTGEVIFRIFRLGFPGY